MLLSGSLFSCCFITAACFSLSVPSDSLQWQKTAPKCNANVTLAWDNAVPEQDIKRASLGPVTGSYSIPPVKNQISVSYPEWSFKHENKSADPP